MSGKLLDFISSDQCRTRIDTGTHYLKRHGQENDVKSEKHAENYAVIEHAEACQLK